MKKLFFVTLVALALTACSFEMPELNIPTPDESQDITADNGDFTAAIGKTYTWTEAHVFPIFASSQTADDERRLSIRETEDCWDRDEEANQDREIRATNLSF